MGCSTRRATVRPQRDAIVRIRRRVPRLLRSAWAVQAAAAAGLACAFMTADSKCPAAAATTGRAVASMPHRPRSARRARRSSTSRCASCAPGPTGARNFTAPRTRRGPELARGAPRSQQGSSTSASSSTPGTMGRPGKWPAKAGMVGRNLAHAAAHRSVSATRRRAQPCAWRAPPGAPRAACRSGRAAANPPARCAAGSSPRRRVDRNAASSRSRGSSGATTKATSRDTPSTVLPGCSQKAPSLHAFDAVEVVVQVRQRAALAGDVDQVVGAAEQPELAWAPAPPARRPAASAPARGRR